MAEHVTVGQFDELYATFTRSVFRWEAQPAYYEPEEAEPFQLWRETGEPTDLAYLADWLATVRAAVDHGKRFERVRVHQTPPTTYQRWATEIATANAAAGENIRVMAEADARRLELPAYDFCIFDDRLVARMEFGESGMTGAVLADDAAELACHRTWRDEAWQHAIPFQDYRAGPLAERGT
ncbi:DUF6879 family protein [Actinophytocola sediminis]